MKRRLTILIELGKSGLKVRFNRMKSRSQRVIVGQNEISSEMPRDALDE